MIHRQAHHTTPFAQTTSPKRLGLFGGSFNPIHNGHLAIARDVRARMNLARILFIPTGDPPHKQNRSLAPAPLRHEMVRLAIADTSEFAVSTIEIDRTGKSYSIDTVREIRAQYSQPWEIFFIIGLDAFLDFPTWRNPEAILNICHVVVVPRPGQVFRALADLPLCPNLDPESLAQLDAGAIERLEIALPDALAVTCLSISPCPISASEIRRRIRSGLPLANMLPPSVESYILQHSLYQEDSNRTRI
ncbi:MAG: nicotinate-nucleotide adenylyltransferase [Nitrospira sp.]|nr:nicotinate-nucleotide adenylyltransferase [Nitrospira sp.]